MDRPICGSLYSFRNLSVLTYANSFTLWHYKLEYAGDIENVKNNARKIFLPDDMLRAGDLIIVSSDHGGFLHYVEKDETK